MIAQSAIISLSLFFAKVLRMETLGQVHKSINSILGKKWTSGQKMKNQDKKWRTRKKSEQPGQKVNNQDKKWRTRTKSEEPGQKVKAQDKKLVPDFKPTLFSVENQLGQYSGV